MKRGNTKMKRYKVPVNIYVDSENEESAEILVSRMMCGTETMPRMWDVGDAEFKFEHEDIS